MTIPLKYQLDKKLIEQIRQDERNKALDEVEKIIKIWFKDDLRFNMDWINDERSNLMISSCELNNSEHNLKQQLKELREK